MPPTNNVLSKIIAEHKERWQHRLATIKSLALGAYPSPVHTRVDAQCMDRYETRVLLKAVCDCEILDKPIDYLGVVILASSRRRCTQLERFG